MLRLNFGALTLTLLAVGGFLTPSAAESPADARKDTQLRAMIDELERSKTLKLNELEKPYFIQYTTSDAQDDVITASFGGLVSSSHVRARHPQVQVRVGDYQFDNTDSVYSGRARLGMLPIDDDYGVIRAELWLSTDGLYKAASDQFTRKRNALRDIADPDKTPDLSPAQPVHLLQPAAIDKLDSRRWEQQLRRFSAEFVKRPGITSSTVRLRAISSTYRLVNSEGTVVRVPQDLSDVTILAGGFAPDGSRVWNHDFITVLRPAQLPGPDQIAIRVEQVAAETEALTKAPKGDDYSGPVLFEGEAASEMMAQTLTDAIRLARKPVAPSGSNESGAQMVESVWATRVGQKVTPEWMTLVDDPGESQFAGTELSGTYMVDDEGIPAARVSVVEKGVLRGFLLSRQPVRTFRQSNGHGRLPGPYGGEEATIGNLFVQVDHPTPESEMRGKLLEKVRTAGLKYGMIIRRLDFPSTATFEELRSLALQAQKSGYARTLNAPILALRLYLDGHEELVRGLRFREFSAKDLRDIDSASDHPYVLNYVNNGSSFNLANSGADATTSAVICPSLLLDNLDLGRAEEEADKLPIVPPPAFAAQ